MGGLDPASGLMAGLCHSEHPVAWWGSDPCVPMPGMRRVGFGRLCRGVWRKRIDEASDLLCVCVCVCICICICVYIYIYIYIFSPGAASPSLKGRHWSESYSSGSESRLLGFGAGKMGNGGT